MPLADLVRHINQRHHLGFPRFAGSDPIIAAPDGAFVHFANLRLESVFLPISEPGSGFLHGYAADLEASGLASRIHISQEAVFVLPTDDEQFVFLDRLVRTLHVLNFLSRSLQGNLLLKVHRRHVLSVPANHGLAFEEILRLCGLAPDRVTLELDGDGLADESSHFTRAIASYRKRGYGIAIRCAGRVPVDMALLRRVRPDIVKLERGPRNTRASLEPLAANLHDLGALVLVLENGALNLRRPLRSESVDLVQAKPSVPGRQLAV